MKPTSITQTLILQKKAVRLMSFSQKDAPSSPIFKDLQILKLNDLITRNNVNFVHKTNCHLPISKTSMNFISQTMTTTQSTTSILNTAFLQDQCLSLISNQIHSNIDVPKIGMKLLKSFQEQQVTHRGL